MQKLILAAILAVAPAIAWAAEPTILPKPGSNDLVGIIHVDEPSGWAALMITGGQFRPVNVTQLEGSDEAGYKTCVVNGPAGSYAVIQNTGKRTAIHALQLGFGPTPVPPTPIPPTPVPPDPPVPVPPDPPIAGPRQLLIFRESADDTPQQALMFTSLQAGKASQHLRSKGHDCFVLDDDAEDAEGRTAAVIESWKPHFADMTRPVLIITDKASGKVLHKVTMPKEFSDQDVLNLLSKFGG